MTVNPGYSKLQKPQTQKMKTTVSNLRNIICALVLIITSTNAFSETGNQSKTTINNLTAIVQNNNLVINWMIAETATATSDYCEVQGSNDGVTFTSIGMVMGADPKNPGSYSFKQNLIKMKAGKKFYRILTIENSGKTNYSNIIKAVK